MVSTAKLSALVIVFIVSSFCGTILPYLVLRFLRKKYSYSSDMLDTILGILNCFSGGVFFSTSILALLPEAREQLEEAHVLFNDIDNYPATELILGMGFLLILIIENITIFCHKKHSKKGINSYTIALKEQPTSNIQSLQESVRSVSITSLQVNGINKVPKETSADKQSLNGNMGGVSGQGMTNLRNVIMLLALSIHMLFDGLELGLLDKENKVWSVLLALSIHKILILFSMGVKMCENTTFVKFSIAMLFLSAVSPAGIGIGILMTSQGENILILRMSAVLQSLAVGTFVYITFFEILVKEFISSEGNNILKTISTVVGFASFAVISYLMPG